MTQAAEFFRLWDDIVERAKTASKGHGYILEFKTSEPRQIYPTTVKRAKKR
jgi:hypothetical protein